MKGNEETIWVVNVPVATVWTTPDSPRDLDLPGIGNPVNLDEWLSRLTYEPRLALSNDNLVQSQLLYGEQVLLEEVKGDWAHVIIPTQPSKKDKRGYLGWVPLVQLSQVSKDEWVGTGIAVVTNNQAMLMGERKEGKHKVSFLTYLPLVNMIENLVKVVTPEGTGYFKKEDVTLYDSVGDIPKGTGSEIVNTGKRFLGLDYFWGGMSSFGYDCSGFSYNMLKAHGYQIPRDASDQVNTGMEVPLNELQTGDLLFFAYENGKGSVHHVGIYCGDGKMIHSPNTGKTVEITTLSGTIYEKELCAARRYWE